MAKSTSAKKEDEIAQHTIRVPLNLEKRVKRCMEIEGLRTYNDFVLSALTRRCRQIERDEELERVKPASA